MKRREFVAGLAGSAAWPLASQAQRLEPVRLIAVLTGQTTNDPETQRWFSALLVGLQEHGWSEGRNIHVEYRAAGGDLHRLKDYAAQLLALRPEVIVANPTPTTAVLQQQTREIPIVFVAASDPIGSGFAKSLARPGGNITGFTNFEPAIGGKWLELLRELAPGTERVGMLFNPETAARGSAGGVYRASIETAAQLFNLEFTAMAVHDPSDIDAVILGFAREPKAGLLVMPNLFTFQHQRRIVKVVAEQRLPAIYTHKSFVLVGGLAAYGFDVAEGFRRAASYVDRILRGEKPEELPIQGPTKYEMFLNRRAASALGLTIPPSLLARADEVIE